MTIFESVPATVVFFMRIERARAMNVRYWEPLTGWLPSDKMREALRGLPVELGALYRVVSSDDSVKPVYFMGAGEGKAVYWENLALPIDIFRTSML